MYKYLKIFTTIAILAASSNPSFAGDHFDPFFEILVLAGFTTLDATDATLSVTQSETDKLVQTKHNDWNAWTGQLGIGYVYPLTNELTTGEVQWFSMINPQLNIYYLGNGDLYGDVYRYESADLNQMDYAMNFDSTRLMFDLGLTIASIERFSIYALAGAGIGWNKVDFNATEKPDVHCPISSLELHSHSSSDFAYEFGGGITFAGSESASISLEYLYAGLTGVKLGNGTDSDFDLEGSSFQVNTQTVLLGLRFAL